MNLNSLDEFLVFPSLDAVHKLELLFKPRSVSSRFICITPVLCNKHSYSRSVYLALSRKANGFLSIRVTIIATVEKIDVYVSCPFYNPLKNSKVTIKYTSR
jgi:hypothetical protein